jgi:hypothetical protein
MGGDVHQRGTAVVVILAGLRPHRELLEPLAVVKGGKWFL